LFFYLLEGVNNQIADVLQNMGQDVLADQVRSDKMFMVDKSSLSKSGLVGPPRDFSYAETQSRKLAKTILKRIDPSDNEYNYNLLVNSAMRFATAMSDADFDRYFYEMSLHQAKGNSNMSRVNFANNAWVHPTVIAILALTLMMIMSQVKF